MKHIHIDTLPLSSIKKPTLEKLQKYDILAIIGGEEELKRCIKRHEQFSRLYEYFLVSGKEILLLPPINKSSALDHPLTDPLQRLQRYCEKRLYDYASEKRLKLPLYVLLIHDLEC